MKTQIGTQNWTLDMWTHFTLHETVSLYTILHLFKVLRKSKESLSLSWAESIISLILSGIILKVREKLFLFIKKLGWTKNSKKMDVSISIMVAVKCYAIDLRSLACV